MIAPSEFQKVSEAGLQPVVLALQETFNGENAQPTYLFRRFLNKKYSIDGTYKVLGVDNGLIAADVIALDSPLPVKSRPSIREGGGEIPKIGTELPMNETELKQLRLLRKAEGNEATQVKAILFGDTRRVYGGVLEQIEWQFLQGLSQGFFVRDVPNNVGVGIRVDFKYQNKNLFNASIIWGQTGYTPISDMRRVVDQADVDGVGIRLVLMDRASAEQVLVSDEARTLYANSLGIQNGTFVPTFDQLNAALSSRFGFIIEIISRSVTFEINATKTTIKPWAVGQVVFLNSEQIGTLVWSDVEEMEAPVEAVVYARAEQFILISQYKTIRPSLRQYTASQAVACPIINGFNIYKLDTTSIAV